MEISTKEVQQFLIELIEQANYPGKMLEFVVRVKEEIISATISE